MAPRDTCFIVLEECEVTSGPQILPILMLNDQILELEEEEDNNVVEEDIFEIVRNTTGVDLRGLEPLFLGDLEEGVLDIQG